MIDGLVLVGVNPCEITRDLEAPGTRIVHHGQGVHNPSWGQRYHIGQSEAVNTRTYVAV